MSSSRAAKARAADAERGGENDEIAVRKGRGALLDRPVERNDIGLERPDKDVASAFSSREEHAPRRAR
jgi:hypothetical protein